MGTSECPIAKPQTKAIGKSAWAANFSVPVPA